MDVKPNTRPTFEVGRALVDMSEGVLLGVGEVDAPNVTAEEGDEDAVVAGGVAGSGPAGTPP
jgi:hypothetical protein